MDTNRVEGWYPQIKLLDELHEEQPNSTFVLIFRPLKDWFNSINHWPGIKERMSKFTMPGLVLTKQQQIDIQLGRWWCSHVNHIRDYVKQYPSHKLIELDLYDTKTSSEVLDDIFQKHKKHEDEDSSNGNEKRESCWGHANVNKKAATTT
ncbi:hypothetical protein FRACYDRAFT_165980 [Fragilariopsis cylindrus CCMP1102]|uniref:Sulfotransferase domain-containing protein n=1 Tax=Fragilariopsis cylindrus CCMP1102 TaxID=635003 RepID=A0A1E7FU80_9STRA|nr:hypothetical protein FRACYDRAFT_165980 [Fragilariopsis cylindrus CCMP1102]|eukprot:OEU21667.1 hypothetical protein FRACYDRAFT_165980 [Fragilariopsis cylindrus CCMP1102]